MIEIKKLLAVSIILLFLGVAVAPSINTSIVKASQEDDLVEVTTQACGIQGYKDTTVKLTREQYNDLEQYLVEFRARLNQASTREEAVPLFKDAVIELDKYGLLPRGMSIERAQRLVVGEYWSKRMQCLEKMYDKNPYSQNGINNSFCLVAGNTTENLILGPFKVINFAITFIIMSIVPPVLWGIEGLLEFIGLEKIANMVDDFSYFLLENFVIPTRGIPFEIGGLVTFGSALYMWEEPTRYYASNGWIYTNGLRGLQSLNGSFYGSLREIPFLISGEYQGLSGFTGIILRPWRTKNMLFLGSALRAGVSTNHPW